MNRRSYLKSTAGVLLGAELASEPNGAAAQNQLAPGDTRVWQPIVNLHFADESGVAQWWVPELVLLGNTDVGYGSFREIHWKRQDKNWMFQYLTPDQKLSLKVSVRRIEEGWLASLTVGNRSDQTWPNVVSPVCLLLRASNTFVDVDWRRTYFRSDGQFLTYHGRQTSNGKPVYQMSLVKGREQIERTERHQKKWGFTNRASDDGIIGVISQDRSTVLTTTWKPTHHLQANLKQTFSCIHANPYIGTLEPGDSNTVHGCVVLTPGNLDQAWANTKKAIDQV